MPTPAPTPLPPQDAADSAALMTVSGARATTSAFVRFINLLRAIQALPAGVALDAQEERLMQELAVSWAECECVPVHVALRLLPDASASTAKRRIKSLAAKGLLTLERVDTDARIRCVRPTDQGRAYLQQLDRLMHQAVRGA